MPLLPLTSPCPTPVCPTRPGGASSRGGGCEGGIGAAAAACAYGCPGMESSICQLFFVRISRQWINATLNAILTTIEPTILYLFTLLFFFLLFFVDPPPVLVPPDPGPGEGVHDAKQLQLDAGSLLKVRLLGYDLGSV